MKGVDTRPEPDYNFNMEKNMVPDLLTRLQRLGLQKGVGHLVAKAPAGAPPPLPPAPAAPDLGDEPQPLERLLPGLRLEETDDGACYVLDQVYPLGYWHGADKVGDLLGLAPAGAAAICRDERLAFLTFPDFLFLDTETTGLAGAGTLAFMVGVAFFEGEALVVRQFFLRDHGDEPAMLLLLGQLLATRPGLITFNGRSFDLPLLDGRCLMNRSPLNLLQNPHFDLLPPARRLWRARFGSCALGALEKSLLGVGRTQEDIPGWLIPGLYAQFLQTGDGREMSRVFYHNRLDILSMVTLAARVLRLFTRPEPADHPIDLFSLGKWQMALGLPEAEQTLRRAIQPELPSDIYQQALFQMAHLLLGSGRRAEAVQVWQQIAVTTFEDVTAHIELAKHYEWHEPNLPQAITWTKQALTLTRDPQRQKELEHRLARLQRKL